MRAGYVLVAPDYFDGPFPTLKEAMEAASGNKEPHLTIRTVVTLCKRNEKGQWETVH